MVHHRAAAGEERAVRNVCVGRQEQHPGAKALQPLMFDQFFWAEQLVWRGLSPDMHGTTLRSLLQAPSAAAAAGREQRALAEPAPAPLAMASPSAGGAELEFTALEEALCTVTAPAWAPGLLIRHGR